MMVSNARINGRTFHEDLLPSMYVAVFPEEDFNANEQYMNEVNEGALLAKDETLVVGGLAYNLTSEQITMLEKRINYVSEGWNNAIIYVYGLDSKDECKQHLIDWSNRDKRVILLPKIDRSWKKENVFVKMSNLRNVLHNYISLSLTNTDKHFYLTMDYDIGGPISKDGIYHARYLMNDQKVGVVYANGIVSDSFINTIPGLKGWCFPGLGYSYYDDLALIVDADYDDYEQESKLWKWFHMAYGRGQQPLNVKSAYGGAGLMRLNMLKYASFNNQTKVCEHHSFNKDIISKGYKILVDPSFLLLAGCQGHHLTRKVE
jgi:hypothetical protein